MINNQSRQTAYYRIEKKVMGDSSDNELTFEQLENLKKEDEVTDLSSGVKLMPATNRNIGASEVSLFEFNINQRFVLKFFPELSVYHIWRIKNRYCKNQITEQHE